MIHTAAVLLRNLGRLLGKVSQSPPMPCWQERAFVDAAWAAVNETSLHQRGGPKGREYQSGFQHPDTRERAMCETVIDI